MKVSVILGHPKKGSFSHAIAETVVNALREQGHEVALHDLYEEKFDPVLFSDEIPKDAEVAPAIKQHCDELAAADGVVVIHPNWWGQPPAMLKGWIDRVIRPGVAYEFLVGDKGEGVPRGLLKAKAALVFNTSNTEARREQKMFGDPLETLWKNCIFGLCGVRNVRRRTFGVIVTSTAAQRRAWLREVKAQVKSCFSS